MLRNALPIICLAAGVAAAVSGCTGLEWFTVGRVRAQRQRVLQLYGDCLAQAGGEARIVAKYCTASADLRFVREQNAPQPLCPVEQWLCRFDDFNSQ